MNIVFILLIHGRYDHYASTLHALLDSGQAVVAHLDKKSQSKDKLHSLTKGYSNLYIADSVEVTWGEWSIVQATLNCLSLVQIEGLEPDYCILLSGSCMPFRSLEDLTTYLRFHNGKEFIEANHSSKRWVVGGIQSERWHFYHFVNWRNHPKIFSFLIYVQKKLNICRKIPLGHEVYIGSQWWALTWKTCAAILKLCKDFPEVGRFYEKTWIPDEHFFQTMVANLVSSNLIAPHLMNVSFNTYGTPDVYYNDCRELPSNPDKFFIRKVDHMASDLKKFLRDIWLSSSKQNSLERFNGSVDLGVRSPDSDESILEKSGIGLNDNSDWNYFNGDFANTIHVIIASKKNILEKAHTQLNQLFSGSENTGVCQGFLFDQKCIHFNDDVSHIGGYHTSDVNLRDFHIGNFLRDMIFYTTTNADDFFAFLYLADHELAGSAIDKLKWQSSVHIHHVISVDLTTYDVFLEEIMADNLHLEVKKEIDVKRFFVDRHCKYSGYRNLQELSHTLGNERNF